MKFRDLLERWGGNIQMKSLWGGETRNVDWFESPSQKDVSEIVIKNGSIRLGITDSPSPKVYAWAGNILHNQMHKKHLKFDLGVNTQYRNPPYLDSDAPEGWKSWEEIKHKKEVAKAIRRVFPRAEELHYYPRNSKSKDREEASLTDIKQERVAYPAPNGIPTSRI